jgi:hypothetical protein
MHRKDIAYLGPITMRQNHIMTHADYLGDVAACPIYDFFLLIKISVYRI